MPDIGLTNVGKTAKNFVYTPEEIVPIRYQSIVGGGRKARLYITPSMHIGERYALALAFTYAIDLIPLQPHLEESGYLVAIHGYSEAA